MSWRRPQPNTKAIEFQDGINVVATQQNEARFASLHSEIETLRQQASNNTLLKEQNARINDVLAQNDIRKELSERVGSVEQTVNSRIHAVEERLAARLGSQLQTLERKIETMAPRDTKIENIANKVEMNLRELRDRDLHLQKKLETNKLNQEYEIMNRLQSLSTRIDKIDLAKQDYLHTNKNVHVKDLGGAPCSVDNYVKERLRASKLERQLKILQNSNAEYI